VHFYDLLNGTTECFTTEICLSMQKRHQSRKNKKSARFSVHCDKKTLVPFTFHESHG
jgi:hypothetical protein